MARIGNINYDGNDQRFKAIKDLLNSVELQEIEANPSDTPTESLESLRIDEEVYSLGGGTVVVPNPQGTPTDELNSIQIGSDIYEIKGGSSEIADLEDVDLNTLSNGQILKYNSTSQKWENDDESGGTVVIANPSGTPTDELNSIQIGNDIYEIAGGGSGGGGKYTVTTLNTDTITAAGEVTLADSITKFDDILVIVKSNNNGASIPYTINVDYLINNCPYSTNINDRHILFSMYGTEYIRMMAGTDTNKLYFHQFSTESVVGIYGIKYGSGGSGGGSAYSEEVLWDYATDNSGTIPYGLITITLPKSIDQFDAISVELISSSGDSGNWEGTCYFSISVDALNNTRTKGRINYTSFDQRSSNFYISGTTFQKVANNVNNTNGLIKIIGVKYGSGGGSGASSVSELTDVELNNLSDGQILKYDATNEKWVNADGSGGGSGSAIEIIPITDPTNTTSRTFTLSKTPKKISMSYNTSDNWYFHWEFIWGDPFSSWAAKTSTVGTPATTGLSKIDYDSDGKSFTITGSNAAQAANSTGGSGQMLVQYESSGGSGGSSKQDIIYSASAQADVYNLSHPLTDYDVIEVLVKGGTNTRYRASSFFTVNELIAEKGNTDARFAVTTDGWYHYFSVTDESTLARQDTSSLWVYAIIGIKFGGGGNTNKYSTDETVVGEWIDGKPIYRLVFMPWKNGVLQSGYTYSNYILTDSPFKNVNAELVTNVRVINIRAGSDGYIDVNGSGITSQSGTGNDTAVPNTDGTIFVRISNSSSNNKTVYIILEYTKTTD